MGEEKWDREGPQSGTYNKSRLQSQSQQPSLLLGLREPRMFLSVRLLLLCAKLTSDGETTEAASRGCFTDTLGSLGELWVWACGHESATSSISSLWVPSRVAGSCLPPAPRDFVTQNQLWLLL